MREYNVIPSETSPVVATQPAVHLSEKYRFVSTADVLSTFQARGWQVTNVSAVPTRKAERQGYQRHLVRMEHPSFPSIPGLTEANYSRPQLCLLNSHDGTTSFQLFLGLVRIACLNGLIAGTALKNFRAVHSQNVLKQLEEGIDAIANNVPQLIEQVQLLQSVQLTEEQEVQLANKLYTARLANVGRVTSISPYQYPRREADVSQDAFTVLNRIQERMIRGGISYTYERQVKDAGGNVLYTQTRTSTSRRLASVTAQLNLNRLAYDEALKLVGHKQAA
jgi:hypothetical protein